MTPPFGRLTSPGVLAVPRRGEAPEALVPAGMRRLLLAWLGLAVGSLVVAGLFAAVGAFARTPALYRIFSAGAFRVALVTHVTFAFTVWFVTFAGALWVYAAWRAGARLHPGVSWGGLGLAASGALFMAVPAVTGSGVPHLSDYVPGIDHPLFWAGLGLCAAGVSLQAAAYLAAWLSIRRRGPARAWTPEGLAMAVGALAILLATGTALLVLGRLAPGTPLGYRLRVLFWGPGHLLQFLHVAGMLAVWLVAAAVAVGAAPPARRTLGLLVGGLVPFMGLTAGVYLWWRPEALLTNHLVTLFTFWGLGAGAVPAGVMVVAGSLRAGASGMPGARRLPWASPLFSGTVLSMALFAVGGLLGVVGFNQDTRVPAHYHGMVGAVTLAYMGFVPMLLEICGRRPWSDRLTRWQPHLYAAGLVGIMAGMHWAGGQGAPRKTFGFGWANTQALIAMNVMGVGSLLAILGGLAFVWNVGVPLVRRPGGDAS